LDIPTTLGKHSGKVKWFDLGKRFGFIVNNDGSGDLFVHSSEIRSQGKLHSLADGEQVIFDIKNRDGKQTAINVTGPNGVRCIGKPTEEIAKKLIGIAKHRAGYAPQTKKLRGEVSSPKEKRKRHGFLRSRSKSTTSS